MTDAAMLRPQRTRWLFVALVVSLLFNAFFVGAAATDVIRLQPGEKRTLNFELRWLEERLAPEDFAKVESAVVGARQGAEGHVARLKELRQELGVLVAVSTPDLILIDAKLAEIRAEQQALVSELQDTVIGAVLALPPESRQALANGAR
jgi:uncharacterized membrane protein